MIRKYLLKLTSVVAIIVISSIVAARFTIFVISYGVLPVRGIEVYNSDRKVVAILESTETGGLLDLISASGRSIRLVAVDESTGLFLHSAPETRRAMMALGSEDSFISLLDENDIQRIRISCGRTNPESARMYFSDSQYASVLTMGLTKYDGPFLSMGYLNSPAWTTSLTEDGLPFTCFHAPTGDKRLRLELSDTLQATITNFDEDGTPRTELFHSVGSDQ